MIAFGLALALEKIKWVAGALFIIGLIFTGVYLKGRSDGAASCREQAVKATQSQISERGKTDAKIGKMDVPDLCVALGGVMRHGRCE